ncbi:unnamed protein product [Lathyrus sativus]|nr:unnamed protein product [Lathyrus sativus]
MEKLKTMKKKFDPLPHFTLHRVLSQVSPQFYTKDELTQIEKTNQVLFQKINHSLISDNKVERVEVNDLKSCQPSKEEKIVKPKLAIKRKSRNQGKEILPSPPPELPNHINILVEVLDGTDVKYIMCKTLYSCDLTQNHNRLSMPISQIKCDFLTEIEKKTLEEKDEEKKPKSLDVIVLDPDFNEFSVCLKKWDMNSTSTYNLAKDWTKVLSKNNFKKYQKIDIWSFRVDGKLHFLLDNNEPEEIENTNEPEIEDTNDPEEIEESGEPKNSIVISNMEEKQSEEMKIDDSK